MTERGMPQEHLGRRRYDLDWLRIGAFILLIFYHVGMYYVRWDWHVKSPRASATIEPLMLLTGPWRLSLLFLISGVATGYLWARRGEKGFFGARSVRLLVPLVFGMAFIVPPQSYLEVVEKIHYPGSFGEFWLQYISGYDGFCRGGDCLVVPTWNHLWFVAYLWVYTLILFILIRAVPRSVLWMRTCTEKGFSGLGILLWPILYLVVIRVTLAGLFPSTHGLVDDWYNHARYAPMFFMGFALAGTRGPWVAMERMRWGAFGFAVLGWAFLCAYLGMYGDDGVVPPASLRQLQRVVIGAQQWLAMVAVIGFARRHLDHDNAMRRYLTTSIFPVYILHQTVIVVVAHALQPAKLSPVIESFLLVMVTGAACFLGYEGIRRVTVLRPLFGLALETSVTAQSEPSAGPVAEQSLD